MKRFSCPPSTSMPHDLDAAQQHSREIMREFDLLDPTVRKFLHNYATELTVLDLTYLQLLPPDEAIRLLKSGHFE